MPRRCWKHVRVTLTLLFVLYVLLYIVDPQIAGDAGVRYAPVSAWHPRHPTRHLLDSLGLDEDQCDAAFPGLTKDINDTVALGPFALKQARNFGPLQAKLKNGKLYIIHKEDGDLLTREMLEARSAALQQIHRAVISSPTPLPDTVIAVNVQDEAFSTSWSYSRQAYTAPTPGSPPVSHTFLMPHFSFWAWPLPFIGSFARAAAAVDVLEARLSFGLKDPRAVWRGTKRYNSAHNPKMREDLLRVTAGKKWADVQELRWAVGDGAGDGGAAVRPKGARERGGPVAANALMIEDFCRYKYVVHTEGITYSGRFQLHQLCGSVLLTPPVAWLQHTTHLIRPIFSSDLDLGDVGRGEGATKSRWKPSAGERRAWPVHYSPREANIVFVAPDWSDLEATVAWLEAHPEVAEGIARRQRDLFVGGGYFSPAAEACYWRSLIRGWARVARTNGEGWEDQEGVPWETFAMLRDG